MDEQDELKSFEVKKTFDVSIVKVPMGVKAVMIHSDFYPSLKPFMAVADERDVALRKIMRYIVDHSSTEYNDIYLRIIELSK